LIFVYVRRTIDIIYGYIVYRREHIDSGMDIEEGDRKRWLKNSFQMNGFANFPIDGKYTDAVIELRKRQKEKPKASLYDKINLGWRLERKYKLKFVPSRLIGFSKKDIRTGRRLTNSEEDRIFMVTNPELVEDDYDFKFLKVHAERRKYSDVEE